jgi:hypothetical protein
VTIYIAKVIRPKFVKRTMKTQNDVAEVEPTNDESLESSDVADQGEQNSSVDTDHGSESRSRRVGWHPSNPPIGRREI